MMPPIHARFDLARWVKQFPLGAPRRVPATGGDFIVGPESVALTEQLRQKAGGMASMGPGVATDVMVWGKGEPANRAATKVGGLPYRPANAPWPVGKEGKPSAFVGQMCFADSRDVVVDRSGKPAALPGDVLLIFAPEKSGIWDDDDEDDSCIQHEWWPLGLTNLVQSVPRGDWTASKGGVVEPCYAELHRTGDFVEVPDEHPIRDMDEPGKLCVIEGGKIGGVPYYAHAEDPRPGVFIAAIGPINPTGEKFPLLNVPDNPGDRLHMDKDFLMFGDMGSLYLFLDHTGLIRKKAVLRWAVKGY